jgi:hypothetical protein
MPWWTHWWAQLSAVAILKPWRVALTLLGAVLSPYYLVIFVRTVIHGGDTLHLAGSLVTFVVWSAITFFAFRWARRATK